MKLPLFPYDPTLQQTLLALPADTRADLVTRGLVRLLNPDEPLAAWILQSALVFPVTLEPGQTVKLSLRYTPSPSWTVVPFVLEEDGKPTEQLAIAQKQYCVSDDVMAASRQIWKDFNEGRNYATEQGLTFNFAPKIPWTGAIAKFHLTVDTGAPDNIASLCYEGIKKTGPTTWEASGDYVTGQENIDVLFLEKPVN